MKRWLCNLKVNASQIIQRVLVPYIYLFFNMPRWAIYFLSLNTETWLISCNIITVVFWLLITDITKTLIRHTPYLLTSPNMPRLQAWCWWQSKCFWIVFYRECGRKEEGTVTQTLIQIPWNSESLHPTIQNRDAADEFVQERLGSGTLTCLICISTVKHEHQVAYS